MLLSNLTTNSEYELYTQALTSSLYREDLVYPGLLSETHTLTVNRSVLEYMGRLMTSSLSETVTVYL